MEMVRTIKFSGPLAAQFGHIHRFAVSSVAEAVNALKTMIPGFEKFLMESKDMGLVFAVMVDRDNVGEERLGSDIGSAREIRFVPVIAGSKKAGFLQIIAGVALIAAGIFTAGGTWAIAGLTAKAVSGYMVGMGISMVVGGVVQLLSPQPKVGKEEKEKNTSYVFNGAVNVQAQGAPVPVLYGEMFTGSVVVSAGINAEDNYLVPTTGKRSSGGNYSGGGSMVGNVIERAINEAE